MPHLSRAIELGFLAPATFADLAEAQARAGRDTAAIETLQKGIEISPYSQLLQKSLVLRYIRLKRYDEAAKTLERYVELFPEDDFMRSLLLKGKGSAGPSNR